jgi:hypothetical protein
VGDDGTVLATIGHDAGLPQLALVDGPQGAGSPPSIPLGPARVAGAMGKWLRSRVRTIARKEDGDVVLHLTSGTPVYYGDAVGIASKNQVLAAVLRWATTNDKQLVAINVKAPLAPTAQLYQPVVVAPPVTVPFPQDPESTDAAAVAAQNEKSGAVSGTAGGTKKHASKPSG